MLWRPCGGQKPCICSLLCVADSFVGYGDSRLMKVVIINYMACDPGYRTRVVEVVGMKRKLHRYDSDAFCWTYILLLVGSPSILSGSKAESSRGSQASSTNEKLTKHLENYHGYSSTSPICLYANINTLLDCNIDQRTPISSV